MTNLKEYFYNTNHYSDPEIQKFIFDSTGGFNSTLLIGLNEEFVICYLKEMDEKNEWSIEKEADSIENLIGIEAADEGTNILCILYSYSEGVFVIEEKLEQYYNLNYSKHLEMSNRIRDFQFCMKKIIESENSKVINKSETKDEAKDETKLKHYKSEVWFRIGVLIASGELNKLLNEYKSATKVAVYLNLEKSRPYISDSKYSIKTNGSQSVGRNTNIYNNSSKLIRIYDHCLENKIEMTIDFIKIIAKLNQNEPK
jgi:hypothetical protein